MVDKLGNKTGGRKAGTPNRVTTEIRDEFKIFLHYASPRIQGLWEQLLEDNPKQALDVIKDYAEFVLPKLQRAEVDQNNRYVDGEGKDLHEKDLEAINNWKAKILKESKDG